MDASSARAGGLFIIANLAAGLFHYLYQVVASRELSARDFADLNSWFATVAMCFALAGLAQYAANFNPASKTRIRKAALGISFGAIVLLGLWTLTDGVLTWVHGVGVVACSCLFGWMLGQAQIRLVYGTMSLANLSVGLTKLAFVALPGLAITRLAQYELALLVCYLPGIWILAVALARKPDAPSSIPSHWSAPLILSLAGSILPQLDLVLMSHTQGELAFQEFARASLFYKGIYFIVAVGAQWLLPQQIQGTRHQVHRRAGVLLVGLSAFLALGLAIASPYLAQWPLKWDTSPNVELVFWSCLHMSLLTILFLLIQECCAHRRLRPALWAVIILAAEAMTQLILRLPTLTYLYAAVFAQVLLTATLWRLRFKFAG